MGNPISHAHHDGALFYLSRQKVAGQKQAFIMQTPLSFSKRVSDSHAAAPFVNTKPPLKASAVFQDFPRAQMSLERGNSSNGMREGGGTLEQKGSTEKKAVRAAY